MTGRIRLIVIVVAVILLVVGGWAWYWFVHGGRAASLARSAEVAERTRAAKMLAEIHNGLSRRTLETLAGDPETIVAVNAVRSLGADESPESSMILLRVARETPAAVEKDTRGSVRGAAAAALGEREDMPVAELIEMLRGEPNQAARCGAAEGLGIRGDRSALPALIDALNDESLGVRVRAIEALTKMTELKTDYRPADPPALRLTAIAKIRAQLAPGD